MEIVCNQVGAPVAWLIGDRVVDLQGRHVAFLVGQAVFNYRGVQVGYFTHGFFRDRVGNALAFTPRVQAGPPALPPIQFAPQPPTVGPAPPLPPCPPGAQPPWPSPHWSLVSWNAYIT
jgi:hypothetical protein